MGALFSHANFNGKYCESSAKWVGAMHFFSRIKSNYALSLAFRLRFYAILTFSGFFNLADHHQKIIWPFQISVRFVFKAIFFYFMVSHIFNISRPSSLSSSGSFIREKRDLTLLPPSSQVNTSFLVYSSQVFFYLLRRYRFCPARRVPRCCVTSYPTLVIGKSSERRFYLAQLGLGC